MENSYKSLLKQKKSEKTKELEKEIKLKKNREQEDLKKIFATSYGRRFLWKLINEECKLYETGFNREYAVMSYNAGKRELGLKLREKIIEIAPTGLEKMALEFNSEKLKIKN